MAAKKPARKAAVKRFAKKPAVKRAAGTAATTALCGGNWINVAVNVLSELVVDTISEFSEPRKSGQPKV